MNESQRLVPLAAPLVVVLLLVSGVGEVQAQAGAGTVRGMVEMGAVTSGSPPMLSPYATRRYRPPAAVSSGAVAVEEVVVYVLAGSSPRAPAGTTVEITQRDQTILPRVTAVAAGTAVEFPNEDDIFHNLFSLSDPHPFNLGRYPPGESRTEVFERPGVVRMFCDIHSEMTGVIRILETTHFTRPGPDGRFTLAGLPAGTHTLVAWHDALGSDTTEVVVSRFEDATVEIRLGD